MYLFGSYHCISEYSSDLLKFSFIQKIWNRVMNLIKNVINPIRLLFPILFHFYCDENSIIRLLCMQLS